MRQQFPGVDFSQDVSHQKNFKIGLFFTELSRK